MPRTATFVSRNGQNTLKILLLHEPVAKFFLPFATQVLFGFENMSSIPGERYLRHLLCFGVMALIQIGVARLPLSLEGAIYFAACAAAAFVCDVLLLESKLFGSDLRTQDKTDSQYLGHDGEQDKVDGMLQIRGRVLRCLSIAACIAAMLVVNDFTQVARDRLGRMTTGLSSRYGVARTMAVMALPLSFVLVYSGAVVANELATGLQGASLLLHVTGAEFLSPFNVNGMTYGIVYCTCTCLHFAQPTAENLNPH
jgi:hypothetical protein